MRQTSELQPHRKADEKNLVAAGKPEPAPKPRQNRRRGRKSRRRSAPPQNTAPVGSHDWTFGWEPTDRDPYREAMQESLQQVKALGLQLSSWDADWLPVPMGWDSRAESPSSMSPDQIFEWLSESLDIPEPAVCTSPIEFTDGTPGEIAPWGWIPEVYETRLGQYWKEYLADKATPICNDGDLDGVTPFWAAYEDQKSVFVRTLEHPEILGVSPEESISDRSARENDAGSLCYTKTEAEFREWYRAWMDPDDNDDWDEWQHGMYL